jgi:hypothetical protein
MQIKRYEQGEGGDRELFGHLGPVVTDAEAHKALGMPITSQNGDVWLLALDRGRLAGFATFRTLKSKHAHLRFLYSVEPAVREELLRAVLEDNSLAGLSYVYTNDRQTSPLWPAHGFECAVIREGWDFVKWSKDLP